MIPDLSALTNFFQSFPIIKDAILIITGLYIIFAFVVLNQVRVMNRVISTPPFSTVVAIISLIHLIVAISLFIYTLVIL